MDPYIHTIRIRGQDLSATFDTFILVSTPQQARKERRVYLGLNYDLARGMQDELLRWAEQQRRIKQVRSHESVESVIPRPRLEVVRPTGEEALEQRQAS